MVVSSKVFEDKIEKIVNQSLQQIKKVKVKRFKPDIEFSAIPPRFEIPAKYNSSKQSKSIKFSKCVPYKYNSSKPSKKIKYSKYVLYNPFRPFYKKKFNKNNFLYTDIILEIENPIEYIILTFHPETIDVKCEPFIDYKGDTNTSTKKYGIKCYMSVIYQSDNVTKNKITNLLEQYYGMVIYDFNKIDIFEHKHTKNPNLFHAMQEALQTADKHGHIKGIDIEDIQNIFINYNSIHELEKNKDEVIKALTILVEASKKVPQTLSFFKTAFNKLNDEFLYSDDKKIILQRVKDKYKDQKGKQKDFKEIESKLLGIENIQNIFKEAGVSNTLYDYFFEYIENDRLDIEKILRIDKDKIQIAISNHFKKTRGLEKEEAKKEMELIDAELERFEDTLYSYFKGLDYEVSRESEILYTMILRHIRYTNLYIFENSFGLNHKSLDGFNAVFNALTKNRITKVEMNKHNQMLSLLDEITSIKDEQINLQIDKFQNYYEMNKTNKKYRDIIKLLSDFDTLILLAKKSTDESLSFIHQDTSQQMLQGLKALPLTVEEFQQKNQEHDEIQKIGYCEQIHLHLQYLQQQYL